MVVPALRQAGESGVAAVSAWHEPRRSSPRIAPLLLFAAASLGLLCLILWKLWETYFVHWHGIVNGL